MIIINKMHSVVKKLSWALLWFIIVGLSLYFYVYTILDYSNGYVPPNFKLAFWESKIWFIGHIAGASVALLLGPLQFWKIFRIKYMRYDRLAGKIFIISSLVASICAFCINLMYDCKACRKSSND